MDWPKKISGAAVVLALLLASACGEDDGGSATTDNFDQKAFLTNIGNALILPAYEDLSGKAASLNEALAAFAENPAVNTLTAAKVALKEARLAFQYCYPYQFGPAESLGLLSNLNVYPVDANKIERNIDAGTYNLGALLNNDAKGFPAIEYLLYGPGKSEAEIIAEFEAGENRRTYLMDAASLIKTTSAAVLEQWSAGGGGYINEFTSDDALGADAGSSLGKLVNALNLSFERNIRDAKIGIPAGIRSLGIIIPEATEAYNAGYSRELAEAGMEAYEMLFLGMAKDGTNGLGFDDYLEARKAKTTAGTQESLKDAITSQFEAVQAALDQVTDPLAEQIRINNEPVQQVFAQMQQLTVLLKTDMASALGVVISYQDNDGD